MIRKDNVNEFGEEQIELPIDAPIELSPTDQQTFAEALIHPPDPSPRLKLAAEECTGHWCAACKQYHMDHIWVLMHN